MRLAGAGLVLAASLGAAAAAAAPGPAPGSARQASSAPPGEPGPESAAASPSLPKVPLAPLPKPPSLELPPPDPAALEGLDAHLARLVSRDLEVRETAVREIVEVERDRLPAIHRRLATLAESSDHEAMKAALLTAKERAKGAKKGEDDDEADRPLDYVAMLSREARPDSKPWRDLVSVVAMARMLRQIGTVAAARELVSIYARFGEFTRLEMQRQLAAMGDHAVAALVEAERHQAKKIATWAARQLDGLGKAIPGEAVQTNDPEVLADVLRAYGRVRDPEAARLVISFANSERTQIREASRQAVVLMGEVANWQLRDTYESVVGRKALREWSWDRVARELFAEFDRLRLSQVYVQFDQGLAAAKAGKNEEAVLLFDQVLAQSPLFERASEMVPAYLAYARAHLDDSSDAASRALRRVGRLAPEGDAATRTADSLLLTLGAETLLERHVADTTLLRRAVEMDPANTRAKALLDRTARGAEAIDDARRRYVGAGAIGAAALAAILVILLRKREPPASATAPAPPGEPAAPPEPAAGSPETTPPGGEEPPGGTAAT